MKTPDEMEPPTSVRYCDGLTLKGRPCRVVVRYGSVCTAHARENHTVAEFGRLVESRCKGALQADAAAQKTVLEWLRKMARLVTDRANDLETKLAVRGLIDSNTK